MIVSHDEGAVVAEGLQLASPNQLRSGDHAES